MWREKWVNWMGVHMDSRAVGNALAASPGPRRSKLGGQRWEEAYEWSYEKGNKVGGSLSHVTSQQVASMSITKEN